jgi:hypothetical protein
VLPSNVETPLVGEPHREPTWRAVQHPLLVGALVFATFNFYALWWFGRTWWQIKQEDGDGRKRPVFHAFTLVVPIYGYFRFYAHMRTIVGLATTPEARAVLGPGTLTIAWVVVSVLAGASSQPGVAVWISILASGLGGAVFGWAQNGLNVAWRSRGTYRRAGLHPLHIILLGVGGLIYTLTILAEA